MVIIGSHYCFTALDKKKLKTFSTNPIWISYDSGYEEQLILTVEYLVKNNHTTIVFNLESDMASHLIDTLMQKTCGHMQYYTIQTFLEKYLDKCYIPLKSISSGDLLDINPYTYFQYIQKRVIDYCGSLILYCVSIPLLYYSRVRMKKESPGTTLYKQLRVGLKGKEFTCIKFRSMALDAEKDGAQFALKNDHRTFNWGATMRKVHIDELPQLFNVLRGDMHLVGPRPERKIWIKIFEQEIPYYHQRHKVRPGIAGWAQVRALAEEKNMDAREKLMYDLYYIKHWNVLLDIKILWQTTYEIFTHYIV